MAAARAKEAAARALKAALAALAAAWAVVGAAQVAEVAAAQPLPDAAWSDVEADSGDMRRVWGLVEGIEGAVHAEDEAGGSKQALRLPQSRPAAPESPPLVSGGSPLQKSWAQNPGQTCRACHKVITRCWMLETKFNLTLQ